MEIKPEWLRIMSEYIVEPQSFIIHWKKSFFEPQSLIIHHVKSIFGPQSLMIHQYGSNYWTSNLFNMVDGMKTAMENETWMIADKNVFSNKT